MPTTTFPCNKDARIAQSGGTNLGAGKSDYLPVGLTGSYLYRSLLGFSYDFAGMVSITSAILHIKTSSQHYLGFGGDPDVNIYRIIEAWSEGSAVEMSTSNAVHWGNQPSVDATEAVGASAVPESENTWWTCDVTNLLQEALADGVFYGLRLRSSDESNSADRTEFYAREYGSNDAYIDVTYSSNTAPKAPTLDSPSAGVITSRIPTFEFNHVDDEGDACAKYKLQVMTGAGTGTMMWDSGDQTSGIVGGSDITKAYGGTALANNARYYWRAVTNDGVLWGPWSGWRAFDTYKVPTTGLSEPGASGIVAKVGYTAGSGWATPRLTVSWTFNDGDLHAQTHYRCQIGTTPGSGNLYDPGWQASATKSIVPTLNLTEGQRVYIRVMVRCSAGEESAWSTERQVATRWGMARFFADLGATPLAWNISSLITTRDQPTYQQVVVEYGSNTSAAAPGTYYSSLASVTKRQWFHYRVWLMTWGGAAPVSPSLDKLVLSYSNNVISPDHWVLPGAGNASIDEAARVYGTQSLKIVSTGNGADRVSQYIKLEPDTHYTVQARIRAQGAAGAQLMIGTGPTGYAIKGLDAGVNDTNEEWTLQTFGFDSGDLDEAYVQLTLYGTAGAIAWYDAIKVEASDVATAWSPGFIGEGVVLDAGGVGIDGVAGGVLRLRGSAGAATDIIELASRGVRFGGAGGAELYSSNPAGGLGITPGSWTSIRGMVAIPFAWTGTLPGAGTQDMNIIDAAAAIVQSRLPFGAQIVGISISVTLPRTQGSLTAQVFNGSTSLLVGPTAVIDASNVQHAMGFQANSGVADVAANGLLRARLTTAGSYLPVTTSVKVIVYVQFIN